MMKKNVLRYLLLMVFVFPWSAKAELVIRITDGVRDGIPIIIVPFQGSQLASIVEANLTRSGRFTLVPPERAGQALAIGQSFDQDKLRASGAHYAIIGRQGIIDLEFEILNAITGERAAGFRIPDHPNERRMAHKAADLIFERLTGIKGAFDTRIAYISVTGPALGQTFQLVVADADGHNPRTVLTSRQPIMSPAWSPDGRSLAYVSFETGNSAIYIQDLNSGNKRVVSAREGINGAPAWSPDGQSLAVSLSEGGSPDIYVISVNSGQLRQITNSSYLNTEPTWANNNTIVYTSGRSGGPQLYRTTLSGGDGTLLTTEGNYNSAASVVGNSVAMVRRVGSGFRIAIMNASSRQSVIVSNGNFDESPSLAPNAMMVIYGMQQGGRASLAVSSVDGKARQVLSSQSGDVRDPAWSPYLN